MDPFLWPSESPDEAFRARFGDRDASDTDRCSLLSKPAARGVVSKSCSSVGQSTVRFEGLAIFTSDKLELKCDSCRFAGREGCRFERTLEI